MCCRRCPPGHDILEMSIPAGRPRVKTGRTGKGRERPGLSACRPDAIGEGVFIGGRRAEYASARGFFVEGLRAANHDPGPGCRGGLSDPHRHVMNDKSLRAGRLFFPQRDLQTTRTYAMV